MKKLFIYIYSLTASLLLFTSCDFDANSIFEGLQYSEDKDIFESSCNLVLSGDSPSFDRTRAEGGHWEAGDEIYVYFSSGIYGLGQSESSTSNALNWTFRYNGNLDSEPSGECVIYYVKGGTRSGANVSLDEDDAVYADHTAKYYYDGSYLTLSAKIAPLSTRFRFMGEPNQTITLKKSVGLKFGSNLDFSTNSLEGQEKDISLTVKEDGYTDFLYAIPLSLDVDLTLISGYESYTKTISPSSFKEGASGYYTVPSALSLDGWSVNIVIPVVPSEPEYVDLGLPSGVLWASCNLGASLPEEYGDLFAWGETSPKNKYDWSTYSLCDGTEYGMLKYCLDSSYGTVDNLSVLEAVDDAATVYWGEGWRTPTVEELEELSRECSKSWITINDHSGWKFTGSNGNSIFIPAAGKFEDEEYKFWGAGCYWSSSLGSSNLPYNVDFDWGGFYIDNSYGGDRDLGHSIRPVYSKPGVVVPPQEPEQPGNDPSLTETGWVSLADVVNRGLAAVTPFQKVRYKYWYNGLDNSVTNTDRDIVTFFNPDPYSIDLDQYAYTIWTGPGWVYDGDGRQNSSSTPDPDGWTYYTFSCPVFYIDKQYNAQLEDIEVLPIDDYVPVDKPDDVTDPDNATDPDNGGENDPQQGGGDSSTLEGWTSLAEIVDGGLAAEVSFQQVRYRYYSNGFDNSVTSTAYNIVVSFTCDADDTNDFYSNSIWLGNGELYDSGGKDNWMITPNSDGWVYYTFSQPIYYSGKQENARLEDVEVIPL